MRDDLVPFIETAFHVALAYGWLLDPNGGLGRARECFEGARQLGVLGHQIQGTLLLAKISILRGDVPGSLASLELAQALARKAGIELSQYQGPSGIAPGLTHFFLGDWDKAQTELLKCLDTGKKIQFVAPTLLAAWSLGQLYLERADLPTAEAYISEGLTLSEAREEKILELLLRGLLAKVAAKGGEIEKAVVHLDRAREILSNGEDWRGVTAQIHLAEGILGTVEKKWQEAEDAFRKAAEINQKYHLPYYEAKSIFEWGQMYLSRNEPGDRERGMGLLDEALAIFQKIQAKKMVEKVLAHKQVLTA